jgi:hypothetical protein
MKRTFFIVLATAVLFSSCDYLRKKTSGNRIQENTEIESGSGEKITLRQGEQYIRVKYLGQSNDGMDAGILQFAKPTNEVFECWAKTINNGIVTIGSKKIYLNKGDEYEIIYQFIADEIAGTNNATEDLSANHIVDIIPKGGRFQANYRYDGGSNQADKVENEPVGSSGGRGANQERIEDIYQVTEKMAGSFIDGNSQEELYIAITGNGTVGFSYRKNSDNNWVEMKWISSDTKRVLLGFQGDPKEYELSFNGGIWYCTNPDGSVQHFRSKQD